MNTFIPGLYFGVFSILCLQCEKNLAVGIDSEDFEILFFEIYAYGETNALCSHKYWLFLPWNMTTVKENRSYRYNLGIRPADLHGILCLQRAKTSAVGIKSEFNPFWAHQITAFCRFCDFNGQNMVIESYILMFQEQCKIKSMTPEEKSVHSSHKIKVSALPFMTPGIEKLW